MKRFFCGVVVLMLACPLFSGCDSDEHVSSFSDAIDVCVGVDHSCAVQSSGKVTCWGSNIFGESDVPDGVEFTAVSCSESYTCGLTKDGAIRCWGQRLACIDNEQNDSCMETPALHPPDEKGFRQLVVGGDATCALRADGTVYCWGNTSNPCFGPPGEGKQYVQIDGNGCSYCGLEASGKVDCGDDNDALHSPPDVIEQPWDVKPLPENILFSSIAVEGTWACGILKDDPAEIYCWGQDTQDALSPTGGTWNEEKIPVTRIDTNLWFKCILREGKKYKCYGEQGGTLSYPPDDNFVKLAMEGNHGCGVLKNGHVRCWGDDYKGKSSPP
ncbi:MAG: hypothetical protein JXX14_20415 [Deltaproteobacteria bacterium]|nr:hypothetical protein [Deltaproteobacteria bacterium]